MPNDNNHSLTTFQLYNQPMNDEAMLTMTPNCTLQQ